MTLRGISKFFKTTMCATTTFFRVQKLHKKIVLKVPKNAGVKKAEIRCPTAVLNGLHKIASAIPAQASRR